MMYIEVSADGTVRLEDRDNFRAFKVVVAGHREAFDAARDALSGIAEVVDADTAWVREDALRGWPFVATDAAWQQALTTMIEKAKPHGWIDERRKAIKAHIEWIP